MIKSYIGIDPGKNGGIAIIYGNRAEAYKMPNTEQEIYELLYKLSNYSFLTFALIEKVHAMPNQGVTSMFNFGKNYGFLRACLIACEIPFDEVTPNKWQKKLQCQTKGDKNITKQKAQQLFPGIKITHAIADALLIAYYNKHFYRR